MSVEAIDANRIIDRASTIALNLFDLSIVLILSVVLFSQNAHPFSDHSSLTDLWSLFLPFAKPFERLDNETMEANSVLSSIIEDINGIETFKFLPVSVVAIKRLTQNLWIISRSPLP